MAVCVAIEDLQRMSYRTNGEEITWGQTGFKSTTLAIVSLSEVHANENNYNARLWYSAKCQIQGVSELFVPKRTLWLIWFGLSLVHIHASIPRNL